MDIKEAQRYLGEVDIRALSEAILAQGSEAWAEQPIRQQTYEVHKDTESIVMLFCDESWPDGKIYKESGWDRLYRSYYRNVLHPGRHFIAGDGSETEGGGANQTAC
jgi:hypothetical protein